jgi:hypothetical protein
LVVVVVMIRMSGTGAWTDASHGEYGSIALVSANDEQVAQQTHSKHPDSTTRDIS